MEDYIILSTMLCKTNKQLPVQLTVDLFNILNQFVPGLILKLFPNFILHLSKIIINRI